MSVTRVHLSRASISHLACTPTGTGVVNHNTFPRAHKATHDHIHSYSQLQENQFLSSSSVSPIPSSSPSSSFSSSSPSCSAAHGRQNLVILGTGWGSYSVLKNIKKRRRLRELFNIIVISPRNHFLFTPLLASTTVGTLEFRSIIEPVRNTGFRDEHHFHLSHAVGLDIEGKAVECVSVLDPSAVYRVVYDKLVIGVGAVSNDFNVPGVKEHAFFLKVRYVDLQFVFLLGATRGSIFPPPPPVSVKIEVKGDKGKVSVGVYVHVLYLDLSQKNPKKNNFDSYGYHSNLYSGC